MRIFNQGEQTEFAKIVTELLTPPADRQSQKLIIWSRKNLYKMKLATIYFSVAHALIKISKFYPFRQPTYHQKVLTLHFPSGTRKQVCTNFSEDFSGEKAIRCKAQRRCRHVSGMV